MIEHCWEYFGCKKEDCPARITATPCWEVENTKCDQLKFMEDRKKACILCGYYKARTNKDDTWYLI